MELRLRRLDAKVSGLEVAIARLGERIAALRRMGDWDEQIEMSQKTRKRASERLVRVSNRRARLADKVMANRARAALAGART